MSTVEFNHHMLSYSKALEHFAYSLTTNRDDALDLLQDTLLKAVVNRSKFQDATNLKAWLYTIMKNTFINNYRRKVKSRTILEQNGDLNYLEFTEDHKDKNPSSQYNQKEIIRAIDDLDEEFKTPFNMHRDGFKYKEIADDLELPLGTVKSRIFLARQKLMNELSEYNPH